MLQLFNFSIFLNLKRNSKFSRHCYLIFFQNFLKFFTRSCCFPKFCGYFFKVFLRLPKILATFTQNLTSPSVLRFWKTTDTNLHFDKNENLWGKNTIVAKKRFREVNFQNGRTSIRMLLRNNRVVVFRDAVNTFSSIR